MDKNKQYKVALLLYTQGLDYDDRVRKEMLTIQREFPNVEFNIFAVEPKNREESGLTRYGVPYRTPYLKSRDKYKSNTHGLAKAIDFYRTVKKELNPYDLIWCADEETFLFVLFNRKKPLVWDLHELPNRFMRNPLMRFLFHRMEKRCSVMVHANRERMKYLVETDMIHDESKQLVIRNYPEQEPDVIIDDKFAAFKKWKGNSKCVYLQGLNAKDRLPEESVSSVLKKDGLKGVVVGRFPDDIKAQLKAAYPKLEEKIFFTGLVPQLATLNYIKECTFGMVFYKCDRKNNIFCEPNRMFQCIVNGIPIIVGKNPTMKNLVEEYGAGVVLEGDGSDADEICKAIDELLANYDNYAKNVAENRHKLDWDYQSPILREIITRAL